MAQIKQIHLEILDLISNTNVVNNDYPNMHIWYLLYLIIMSTIFIYLMPDHRNFERRMVATICSVYYLMVCVNMVYTFNAPETFITPAGFHFPYQIIILPEYGINLTFGVDGVSLSLLLLTGYIMTICIFLLSHKEPNYKAYLFYIFLIYIFLTFTFCLTNLLFFFIFFESVLIPMFIIIGVWGTRERKIKAAYYFFFYTLFGSFFLLYGIFAVYSIVGSLDYEVLLKFSFSHSQQIYLFFFFFIPFAIKIPMVPFHIWLPEAHVEAPTIGSVILAALLLKLGGYGFIRFTISMLPHGVYFFQDFIYVLAGVSILYASLTAIRQTDLKRAVAYASIAHMNLVVVGIFSYIQQGLEGSIYLMLAHGIVSAGLFICVGILSDRYNTREIKHYSGLAQVMPVFGIFFFLFTLGNMSFPGTSNFPGELLILAGIFQANIFAAFLAATGIVLSAVYSIWIFNRIFFGTLKTEKQNTTNHADLNQAEFWALFFLIIPLIVMGLNSSFVTILIFWPVKRIIQNAIFRGRK